MSDARRRLALAGGLLLGVIGLVIALAGAFAPLGAGETRSAFAIVGGAVLVDLAVGFVLVQRLPSSRRPLPAATVRAPGLALPVRTGHRVGRLVGTLGIAALGVVLLPVVDSAGEVVLAVAIAVGGAAFALMWLRTDPAITVDPDGVTFPGRRRQRIAWDDVDEVAALAGWQPSLAVTTRADLIVQTRLDAQAWPPSVLLAVLHHYRSASAEHDRARLIDPMELDRFRHRATPDPR